MIRFTTFYVKFAIVIALLWSGPAVWFSEYDAAWGGNIVVRSLAKLVWAGMATGVIVFHRLTRRAPSKDSEE